MTLAEGFALFVSFAGVLVGIVRLEVEWKKSRDNKDRDYTIQMAILEELKKLNEEAQG